MCYKSAQSTSGIAQAQDSSLNFRSHPANPIGISFTPRFWEVSVTILRVHDLLPPKNVRIY